MIASDPWPVDRRPCVKFAVRRPAGSGRWWYQSIIIPDPSGSAFAPMTYPPAVGDVIGLHDRTGRIEGGPTFRVVARQWHHTGYGSANWPYGQAEPATGPLLDIIVEPAPGIYADETDICAESSCEAVVIDGAWWMPPGADTPDPHDHAPYRETR